MAGETQREWGRPIKKIQMLSRILTPSGMNWLFLTTVKRLMRVCFALFIDPTEKAHDNLKL
ncbi:hypothetical protein SE959_00065 [Escherichia coli]|nr:hypothetical protein [Escherichia coli]